MKQLSEFLKNKLSEDAIDSFLLLEIGPIVTGDNVGYIRWTTLPYDVTFQGSLFRGYMPLVSIDPPRMSNTLDREAYKVTLADVNFQYRESLEAGMNTASIKVFAGYLDNGVARLEPEDIACVYSGRMGGYSYSLSENNEPVCVFEGEAPMGVVALKRSLITSKEQLNREHPDDTSFDQAYVGSKSISLKWGKA